MLPYLIRQYNVLCQAMNYMGILAVIIFFCNGNKEFCDSFVTRENQNFSFILTQHFHYFFTKALAMLQNEGYYKIFYYSMVNKWFSFPLYSQLSKENFTLIILIYCQVRKTDFQMLPYSKNEWLFSWKSSHTPDCIVILQALLLTTFCFHFNTLV